MDLVSIAKEVSSLAGAVTAIISATIAVANLPIFKKPVKKFNTKPTSTVLFLP